MKVSDLIAALSAMPQDAECSILYDTCYKNEIGLPWVSNEDEVMIGTAGERCQDDGLLPVGFKEGDFWLVPRLAP